MIDIFVCQVKDRGWKLPFLGEPGYRLITPITVGCSSHAFQRERRVWAEERATTRYYILSDDDVVLQQDTQLIQNMVVTLAAYPQFAILSLLPSNETINNWRPEGGYEVVETDDVMEHHDVGMVRLVRKGAMRTWPEQVRSGYDAEHCIALRAMGWRVGHFKHLTVEHLGKWKSTVGTYGNMGL